MQDKDFNFYKMEDLNNLPDIDSIVAEFHTNGGFPATDDEDTLSDMTAIPDVVNAPDATETFIEPAVTKDATEEPAAPESPVHETIVEPGFGGTADALTAAPAPKAVDPLEELTQSAMAYAVEAAQEPPAVEEEEYEEYVPDIPTKRNPFMRALGAVIPHVGDSKFDFIRKTVMVLGILVFVGAATYLVDDLILIPQKNEAIAETLIEQYSPDAEPVLNEAEQNFPYPEGMDPAFKKLYYQNPDVRGWISYHSADGAMLDIEYPIMQSEDNDYYLFHDFYKAYNKNGTLFYDYRNDITGPDSFNHNTIIYGHNMASGQMFAGLNSLLDGVENARLAPTFSVDTLYEQADYKVFAVMVVNNDTNDGQPFGYLRTDFNDNVDFANFLAEILARSLYIYGDVDLQPTDEIVCLSTCTEYGDVHFNDGRTVVVGRKLREGEELTSDPNQIVTNTTVLMPYAWYRNQRLEPHPYYTDPNHVIQPLDSLMQYLSTSTAAGGTSTTFPYYSQDGTFGLISSVTSTTTTTMSTTTTAPTIAPVTTTTMGMITVTPPTVAPITNPPTTAIYLRSFEVSSPTTYYVGDSFNYGATYVTGTYSDGTKVSISPQHCAVEGFDSSRPGVCYVVIHYGSMHASFQVTVLERPTQAPATETQPAQVNEIDVNRPR